jgi:hypothetical protein
MLLIRGWLAAFVLALTLIVPELIYLTGNLQEANGPFTYALADFLYGPVKAACLVGLMFALREHFGTHAPRWISLAQLTAVLAAGLFVMAALFRATNRHYHLMHPELNLEGSASVLIVWTTLVGGVIATGWHVLGWTLLLVGTAGWTGGRLPRALSVLYWVAGAQALFVYLLPANEGGVVAFTAVLSIWQGIVLWRAGSGEAPTPTTNSGKPDLA